MVNLLIIPLAKIVISLVGRERIQTEVNKGINSLCNFLESKGFPKQVCRPIGNAIVKLI